MACQKTSEVKSMCSDAPGDRAFVPKLELGVQTRLTEAELCALELDGNYCSPHYPGSQFVVTRHIAEFTVKRIDDFVVPRVDWTDLDANQVLSLRLKPGAIEGLSELERYADSRFVFSDVVLPFEGRRILRIDKCKSERPVSA